MFTRNLRPSSSFRSNNRKSKTCPELCRRIENLKFAVVVGALLFALCPSVGAQQQASVPRVGVIHLGGPFSTMIDGLRNGLEELGLKEGSQFALEIEDLKGDQKKTEEVAKRFEREKVKLIYAVTSPVIEMAVQGTKDLPIVFSIGSDPVVAGFVQSFAKPGGRLTGIHYLVRDLTGKRLEILKEILPKLQAVVTFYDPGESKVARDAAQLGREEAKRKGIRFVERHVTSVEELRSALGALKAGEVDAYFYTAAAQVISQAQLIIDTAKTKKLPTMFHDQSLVAKGALASYGQNYHEVGRLSAKYVQQVLSGAQPRNLKVETVEDVEFAINLKTAKQLGLTVPPNVLARANKVIK